MLFISILNYLLYLLS